MTRDADNASRATILVVDDEADIVSMLEMVLSDEGYDVFGAQGGHEGFGLVHAHRPDLVLIDSRMSQGSGSEFIARLRADEAVQHTPVLLMSALEPEPDLEVSWVRKPFEVDDLLERIRLALDDRDQPGRVPVKRQSGS